MPTSAGAGALEREGCLPGSVVGEQHSDCEQVGTPVLSPGVAFGPRDSSVDAFPGEALLELSRLPAGREERLRFPPDLGQLHGISSVTNDMS